MTVIRGVLMAGRFLTHGQLVGMVPAQQRQALIDVMVDHAHEPISNFRSLTDDDLAGVGAVLVVLLIGGSRSKAQLKTMSSDDQRNTLIVELARGQVMPELQGMTNTQLALLAMGGNLPGALSQAALVQGVLLIGQSRRFADLLRMTSDDQRNTLIVEISKHSNATAAVLQGLSDFELAGAGAALVFLQINGIRGDATLRSMSLDDQRNTAIVEADKYLKVGAKLQGLTTFDVVTAAIGVTPKFFVPLPPISEGLRLYRFSVDSFDILEQKSDNEHSDSDWLSIAVSIGNAAAKSDPRPLPPTVINIERNIKTGNKIAGPFKSDAFFLQDTDVVIVTLVLTNLGSSRIEDQGREAVKVTNKVIDIAGPIIGAAIGLYYGRPKEGAQIGLQVSEGIDKGIAVLSEVFDFLNIHFGPPNCNGVVMTQTITYLPGEFSRAANVAEAREQTGPQENDRCGSPPRTRINFRVLQQALGSGDPNF
jgi:hypothetical protein